MNCQVGDTAVVVNCCFPQNIRFLGEPCEVLAYYGQDTNVYTGKVYEMWWVRFTKSNLPWGSINPELPATDGIWPDAWLKPIRPTAPEESIETESETTA